MATFEIPSVFNPASAVNSDGGGSGGGLGGWIGNASTVSRRSLLKAGGVAAFALGAGGLLAACSPPGPSPSSEGGSPRRGGILKVGLLGAGSAETINPAKVWAATDVSRIVQLYDALFIADKDLKPVGQLATKAERNADGTLWTFHLRDRVKFSDGKPMTAADVIWTMKTWTDPQHLANPVGSYFDVAGIKKLDDLTVQVPLKAKVARLDALVAAYRQCVGIIPDGADPGTRPPGTGPFKLMQFTPGQQSVMARNEHYWQEGRPYVDELHILTTFSDDSARYDALVGGQIDVAGNMPFLQAKDAQSNSNVNLLRAEAPNIYYFYVDVTAPPFDDVRVRQALRLLVDRKQMVETVLYGFGKPANDLFAPGAQFYASDLVRDRDVEKAKSLLKEAGKSDLTITLTSANAFPGADQAAQLLQQQAKDAGVTVNIDQVDVGQYGDPSALYLKMAFAQNYYSYPINLDFPWVTCLMQNSPANETHWRVPESDALYMQAQAEVDEAKATQVWHDAQKMQFDQGGMIAWGQYDNLDALSKKVQGIQPSAACWCDFWNFGNAWLSS
jgi:peptide/nickel transport system substrate-binding protein